MVSIGDLNAIKNIINSQVNINSISEDGYSALQISIMQGNLDISYELIKEGVLVNKSDNNDGHPALTLAALHGYIDIVRELIKAGALINKKGNDGCSALHIAAHAGNLEIVRELIKEGALVNEKDNEGDTPLIIAAAQGQSEVVDELIRSGGSINEKTNEGLSSLDLAAYNNNYSIIQQMLASGANVEIAKFFKSSKIVEIIQEKNLFQKDPIEYILTHNDQAKFALNALKNLESQTHLIELLPEIKEVGGCLSAQSEEIIEDLNAICGKKGLYYDSLEL